MKDTLKKLLVECLNAGKKGSKTGVDPSLYPSQASHYPAYIAFSSFLYLKLVPASEH